MIKRNFMLSLVGIVISVVFIVAALVKTGQNFNREAGAVQKAGTVAQGQVKTPVALANTGETSDISQINESGGSSPELETLAESSAASVQKQDFLTGSEWDELSEEGSKLTLSSDGTYSWVNDVNNPEENYFSGTYKLFWTDSDIDNQFKAVGMDDNDIRTIRSSVGKGNDFCMMEVTHDSMVSEGKAVPPDPGKQTYCVIFMTDNNSNIRLFDMSTGETLSFRKK